MKPDIYATLKYCYYVVNPRKLCHIKHDDILG